MLEAGRSHSGEQGLPGNAGYQARGGQHTCSASGPSQMRDSPTASQLARWHLLSTGPAGSSARCPAWQAAPSSETDLAGSTGPAVGRSERTGGALLTGCCHCGKLDRATGAKAAHCSTTQLPVEQLTRHAPYREIFQKLRHRLQHEEHRGRPSGGCRPCALHRRWQQAPGAEIDQNKAAGQCNTARKQACAAHGHSQDLS